MDLARRWPWSKRAQPRERAQAAHEGADRPWLGMDRRGCTAPEGRAVPGREDGVTSCRLGSSSRIRDLVPERRNTSMISVGFEDGRSASLLAGNSLQPAGASSMHQLSRPSR